MSLARLQSILTNQSATLSSANASLRALDDRLADVWRTLTKGQVDRSFMGHFFYRSRTDLSYRYSSCCSCCSSCDRFKKPKAPSFQIESWWNAKPTAI